MKCVRTCPPAHACQHVRHGSVSRFWLALLCVVLEVGVRERRAFYASETLSQQTSSQLDPQDSESLDAWQTWQESSVSSAVCCAVLENQNRKGQEDCCRDRHLVGGSTRDIFLCNGCFEHSCQFQSVEMDPQQLSVRDFGKPLLFYGQENMARMEFCGRSFSHHEWPG
jgi:hypothetical protein